MNDYPPNPDPNQPPVPPPPPDPVQPPDPLARPMIPYVPFDGYVQKPMNKSAKIFFGILIGLSVTFVGAFLVWVTSMAVGRLSDSSPEEPNLSGSPNAIVYDPSQKIVKNTVGAQTDPDFSGIVLHPPASDELQPKHIYQQIEPTIVGIVSETSDSGSGIASGMIVTPNGYIVTNAHVIGYSRDTKVTVVLSNKTKHPATVVGYDRTSDLAVLKIDANGLPTVSFGSSAALSVGDWVFAIGNPRSLAFSGTLTRGIVSGLDRRIRYQSENSISYIQTDAAINPGNSGGALVNLSGQVVGINSIKMNSDHYEGMGFSISINKAKPVIDSLIRKGYVEGRVRLGITGTTITEPLSSEAPAIRGVRIVSLSQDSPLQHTKAQTGDIITQLDGNTISSMDDLDDLLLDFQPGDSVTLTLARAGQADPFSIEVELLADVGQLQK